MAKTLTDKQQAVIDLLFTEEVKGDLSKAVSLAGYAKGSSVKTITDSLSEEIAEATQKFIARSSTKSAYSLFEILKGDDKPLGRKERITVAKDLLDRAGFAKTDKVEVTIPNALFILPAKDET